MHGVVSSRGQIFRPGSFGRSSGRNLSRATPTRPARAGLKATSAGKESGSTTPLGSATMSG
jgi:hypothetical protein